MSGVRTLNTSAALTLSGFESFSRPLNPSQPINIHAYTWSLFLRGWGSCLERTPGYSSIYWVLRGCNTLHCFSVHHYLLQTLLQMPLASKTYVTLLITNVFWYVLSLGKVGSPQQANALRLTLRVRNNAFCPGISSTHRFKSL